jgi:aspartate ammonia-lyase
MNSSANVHPHRRESDFLGALDIPQDAYWGVHTARAVENFPISGQTVATMAELIRALASVKKAAAQANRNLGALSDERAAAIALNPIIGYEKAALIAKTPLASGGTIAEVAEQLGIMTASEMRALLVPENLTQPIRLEALGPTSGPVAQEVLT